MLVAVTILIIILGLVFTMVQQASAAWRGSTGKMGSFRDARTVFEAVTRTISQTTLNTYYDYQYDASGKPTAYVRKSDLQFICGKNLLASVSSIPQPVGHSIFFQAPLGYSGTSSYTGCTGLLNACGFYLQYGPDTTSPSFLSSILPSRNRYRLMQFLQPSENLAVYDPATAANSGSNSWFLGPLAQSSPPVSQLAENVVALVILPQVSGSSSTALAPYYEYDTRNSASTNSYNQLPPILQVTMVIMDESAAIKLGNAQSNLTTGASFTQASQLNSDLQILEANLSALPGNKASNTIPARYQIFQSSVPILDAKWNSIDLPTP